MHFQESMYFCNIQGSLIVIKRPYKMNFYIIAALLKPIYTIQSGPQKVIIWDIAVANIIAQNTASSCKPSTLKTKQISLFTTRCLRYRTTAFNDSSHNVLSWSLYITTVMTFRCDSWVVESWNSLMLNKWNQKICAVEGYWCKHGHFYYNAYL